MGLFDFFLNQTFRRQFDLKRQSENFAQEMLELAPQVNFAFNSNNNRALSQTTLDFFNVGQRCGGSCLLQIPAKQLQSIGFAYTIIADFMRWESTDVNDIASENGLYCLYKNFTETGNTFVVPAMIQILDKPQYLQSRIYDARIQYLGMPMDIMVQMEYRHLSDEVFVKIAQLYLLEQIYDFSTKQYTIPTDLHLFYPSKQQIEQILQFKKMNQDSKHINKGEEILEAICSSVESIITRAAHQ